MKGICFKENLFNQIIYAEKTQTRRLAKDKPARFKIGEVVYLKEPYIVNEDENFVEYKYANDDIVDRAIRKWKNKLFMPEKFARYFIKITGVKKQKLHEITEVDAIKEGVEFSRPIPVGFKNYITPSNYFDKNKTYDVDSFKKKYSGAEMSFLSLWEKINKGNVFEENPEVYVYDFEVLS